MTTSVKQAIHENDVVELTQAVDKTQDAGQWPSEPEAPSSPSTTNTS